nr:hypothetical protein [Tanacetum cinerariifolium]
MTTPTVTSSTDSQMHNNMMAAGSRDRPPMLAIGRYPQWQSWFLRYIDTRPNGDALRKYILNGPYKPTTIVVQVVAATDDSPAIPEHTTLETSMNMSPANKAHFESEKEAIHLILTRIGDEIYSTVGASQTAQEMWEAIKRLQQGESLNIQDVKTNLFWEFVNVQFLQQLQPEWSRFVTIVKQQHKLDEVSYHKLFDILKQCQKEVNELHAERLARNANPLALKNLALIAKYFKKIYKPTNNNLITSSNSRNKNVDMTLRYKNDKQSRQFGNQRTMNVAGAKENVGSPVVQQSRIQCFNCKEFRHFFKECRNPKRVKDYAYHKEKMLLCKQAEKGVPLQVEQYDWLADTDEEIDDNTCLVGTDDSNVIPDSPDMCDVDIQNDQNDVESDDERFALANLKLNVDENKKIQKQLKKANTTLAHELKECKTILAETSQTLGESNSVWDSCLSLQNKQTDFEKYKAFNDLVKEKIDELIKQSLLTKSHYECLVKQKTKVITDLKLKEEHDIDKMLSMEKQLKFLKEIVYKRSQSIQTIHMMAPKVPTYNGRPTFSNPRYLKQAESEIPCLYSFPYGQSTHANRLIPDGEETLALKIESRSILNKDSIKHSKDQFRSPNAQDIEILIQACLMPLALKTQNDSFIFVHELKQEMHADLKYVESLENEIDKLEYDKAKFSNMYDMI